MATEAEIKEALAAVLAGAQSDDPAAVVLEYAVARWLEARAAEYIASAKDRIAGMADAKYSGPTGKVAVSHRRASVDPEALTNLLRMRDLRPEAGMVQTWVPAPAKLAALHDHGYLSDEDYARLQPTNAHARVTPAKGLKEAITRALTGASTDEDDTP
jgi:hypothetical protein